MTKTSPGSRNSRRHPQPAASKSASPKAGLYIVAGAEKAAVTSLHHHPCARLLRGAQGRVFAYLTQLTAESVPTIREKVLHLARRDARQCARRHIASAEVMRDYQVLRECVFLAVRQEFETRQDSSPDELRRHLTHIGVAFDEVLAEVINAFIAEHTKSLRRLSCSDSLTGLLNHRTFYERLDDELKRAARYDSALTVALIDLDFFKNVNDTLGHQVGDALLVEFAELMKRELRRTDLICRYGGDEFAVILPNTKLKSAHRILKRLPTLLVQLGARHAAPSSFGMSFGVASYPEDGETPMLLVQRADDALFENKARRQTDSPMLLQVGKRQAG